MKKRLASGLLRLLGWRLAGARPQFDRYVLIAAPHTSNWDFPLMLLYAMAFVQLPMNMTGLAICAVPALALLILAVRWFGPHLPANMKIPVVPYTLVITGMLLCASLTAGHPVAALIIGGAWGFAISDLAVARRQFISPDRSNGLWGTPLYFFSQLLLAYTVLMV